MEYDQEASEPYIKTKSCFSLKKVIGVVPANEPSMAKSDIDDTNEQVVMIFRFFQCIPWLEVLCGLYRVLPFYPLEAFNGGLNVLL